MDQEKHTFLQTIRKPSKFMETCDAKEDGNCFLINILDIFTALEHQFLWYWLATKTLR